MLEIRFSAISARPLAIVTVGGQDLSPNAWRGVSIFRRLRTV